MLVAAPVLAFSQTTNFTLQGQVPAADNGKFIKLYYENKDSKVVDSVLVKNGRFSFKGTLNAPTVGKVSFLGEEAGDRFDVFLAEGTVNLSAKKSLAQATVSGTDLAKNYEKLAQKLRPEEHKIFNALSQFKDMPEGDEKKAYITKVLEDLDVYTRFRRETIHQFVLENPNSYVALHQLEKTAQGRMANYETTFPFYDKLSADLKATMLGKEFGERLLLAKGDLTGQPYKDFSSTTPEGKELSLHSILQKNKYTLVDFWASWCGPCRKENPHVVKTYEAFKDKGFTVLSVSLDDDMSRWTAAIEKDGMPWHHVSSLKGWKEPAAALYGVRAIPQNVLIDANGNIVASNLRGETLFAKVQSLLR
ncbi:Thiol-disulfide isomerase or thioredoxin [Sphingobacterium psychroaquaticum]|uniref:Thiol-disulfide isomerase or thioredoxin n=2 Tax=Sphingobacterium psychroaquaticum TaxID=561061 RepID=A0A1X7I886_9SPHI|nr:Thiol-disulfide isomerase or thioredoxin [Sphingobacterium psychroaquaticum]